MRLLLLEEGLVTEAEHKSGFYSYIDGVRADYTLDKCWWSFSKDGKDVIEMLKRDGKTYIVINDYEALRNLFGQLLAEIQRIKSTGDFNAARDLVETYAVKIDYDLHKEILARYEALDIAPYKGFINPVYTPIKDAQGNITDVVVSYTEGYAEQMLRYSKAYRTLPLINE